MDYLIARSWVTVRTHASAGMLENDVLAYNVNDGRIKHIQSKSNHHYTKNDIEALVMVKAMVKAPNVSVELWDWLDNNQYPVITIFHADGSLEKYSLDPMLTPGGLK
jgi:hypothetical protein